MYFRLFLYVLFVLLVVLGFYIIFFPIGVRTDPDSYGYTYFIDLTDSANQAERPPVFPAYLYIQSLFGDIYSSITLRISNYFLNAISIVLIAVLIHYYTRSYFWALCCGMVYFFSYPIFQYSNNLNPEIMLNTLFTVHLLVMHLFIIRKNIVFLILIILSLLFLTFTKPVFLYLPLVTFIYIVIISYQKHNQRKKLVLSSFILVLFYTSIIWGWSFRNYKLFNSPSFSITEGINLTGKLLQYNMIYDINHTKYLPLIKILRQDLPLSDNSIYTKLDRIAQITPPKMNIFTYIKNYSTSIILQHFPEYSIKSLKEIPKIINEKVDYIQIDLIRYPVLSRYFSLHMFLNYRLIYPFRYIAWILAVLSLGIAYKYRQNYLANFISYLVITYFFMILVLSLSAYEQYLRLRSPFDQIFLIIFFISFYRIFTFLKYFLIQRSTHIDDIK